jgi:hypothetical protein
VVAAASVAWHGRLVVRATKPPCIVISQSVPLDPAASELMQMLKMLNPLT